MQAWLVGVNPELVIEYRFEYYGTGIRTLLDLRSSPLYGPIFRERKYKNNA